MEQKTLDILVEFMNGDAGRLRQEKRSGGFSFSVGGHRHSPLESTENHTGSTEMKHAAIKTETKV